ncbi:uncharacterized protein C3orf38-like [Bombina bombina]|uniref:uncharacterized protein C3orf38-like n=1 Tax=Bombina bombina TaxID=8345 RepID=UPI00235B0AF4|nr:uncharacterized protein C3orf38-like [Bombina bombina]
MIWKGSREEAEEFIKYINNNQYNLEFTSKISSIEIEFLDLVLYIDGSNKISVRNFRKATDKNGFLHATSGHLPRWKENIPSGQFRRIRRNCTDINNYMQEAEIMSNKFLQKGYEKSRIEEAKQRGLEYDRSKLLEDKGNKVSSKHNDNGSLNYNLLGYQFCQWFFQLLNSQNSSSGEKRDDWGPQHFWENSVFKIQNKTNGHIEEYNDPIVISMRLLALVKEEKVLFHPQLDPSGLKCAMNSHEMVVVTVAGTVQKNNDCLGIFEQIFGLIRCPLSNKWKIQFCNLNILGSGTSVQHQPSIKYQTEELKMFFN